jgi:hypothetical protein
MFAALRPVQPLGHQTSAWPLHRDVPHLLLPFCAGYQRFRARLVLLFYEHFQRLMDQEEGELLVF